MLAEQLPADARTLRAADPRLAWSTEAYLLALVADNLSFLRYESAGGRGRKPKPLKRPAGQGARAKGPSAVRGMSPDEVMRILSAPRG